MKLAKKPKVVKNQLVENCIDYFLVCFAQSPQSSSSQCTIWHLITCSVHAVLCNSTLDL